MAADPGGSAAYHLFLTRIPPRLPKEEVEAALAVELASRDIRTDRITVVPQSAWKNKGFGFITLSGSPTAAAIAAVSEELDGHLRLGGRPINVRVCEPSATSPAPSAPEPPVSWDQPADKIHRLCAQVLHCFFARRVSQATFKAEKLLSLLSMTIAPARGGEPKPISFWGREVHGSLETMLLAIGKEFFGGEWAMTGTVANRDAVLTVDKHRHMQGWDPLCDPLPIATLLRLAACKQRLDDIHTPGASTGFSTPSALASSCRRCSDCGSLSAVHSSDQPSCSESEACWSLRSLHLATLSAAEHIASECSPSLDGMPSTSSEDPALSSVSTSSCASYNSLVSSCTGSECVEDGHRSPDDPEPSPSPDIPAASQMSSGSGLGSSRAGQRSCSEASSTSGRRAGHAVHAHRRPGLTQQQQHSSAQLGPGLHPAALRTCSERNSPAWAGGYRSCQPAGGEAPWTPVHSVHVPRPMSGGGAPASPPSARDLLFRCARHLELLFHWHPNQTSFTVPYLAEYLTAAPDVVAWGSGSMYFSLAGYATAHYGSFEGLLMQVSRSDFGGCLQLEDGRGPGEPRVLHRLRFPPQHSGGYGSGAPVAGGAARLGSGGRSSQQWREHQAPRAHG